MANSSEHVIAENNHPGKNKSHQKALAGILSTSMWMVGFLLLFVLEPGNSWIWTSDALLLLGFFPLLYIFKAGWTWLCFGLMNIFIGFMLELSRFLPAYIKDPTLWTPEVVKVQEHMNQMHSSITWILIGVISTIWGLQRIFRTVTRWLISKQSEK